MHAHTLIEGYILLVYVLVKKFCRAGMKMANIDAAFDWMFTNPRSTDGVSVVLQSHAEKLSSFYEKIVCSLSFLPIIRTS